MMATFRKPRRDRGRKRTNRRRAAMIGAGVLGTGAVLGGGAMLLRKRQGPVSNDPFDVAVRKAKKTYKNGTPERQIGRLMGAGGFDIKRGQIEGFVGRGVQVAKEEFPVVAQIPIQAGRRTRRWANEQFAKGMTRHRQATKALRMRVLGFSDRPALVTFAKGRKLTKRHREKISRSLKGRTRNQLKERGLQVRESEARARTVRNVGYLSNAVSQGVREARLTARWLGVSPGSRRPNYRRTMRDIGSTVQIARNARGLLGL